MGDGLGRPTLSRIEIFVSSLGSPKVWLPVIAVRALGGQGSGQGLWFALWPSLVRKRGLSCSIAAR